jgi:hypothetical protein
VISTLLRTLIPVESQPVKAIQDDLFGLLGVSAVVGILDTEHKGAPMLAGIDPVEEGGAGSPDME